MIRITGGVAKGRTLKVPQGSGVRPTSDKVRQALFNILSHRFNVDFKGARVLDLFAGSGALGLESLSRGASYAQFVELESRHARLILENCKVTSALMTRQGESAGQSAVRTQSVDAHLTRPPEHPYELIFMDPPYALCREVEHLKALEGAWLAEGGYVIIEHTKHNLFELPDGWIEQLRRRYGDTYITICSSAA